MARDLYGELLSNALNRKAPRNHFAAYINPNEAAMLRSQGGGVAPGGGQYMANGLPAFIEDVGEQAWSGPSGEATPSGWGLDYGAEVHQAAQARAAALEESEDFTARQPVNLEAMLTSPTWASLNPEERQAQLSRPISQGGIGRFAPGSMLAGQDATATEIAHVMTPSASGGYAINDPSSDVSVPAGYHMGWFPSVMGSLIGMANPAIGLATALSDFPTLGSRAMRGIREEIPEIGQVANFLGAPARLAGDVLSQGFAPIGRALASGAQGLGDFLQSNIGSGDPAVADFGPPSHGGFDPPFVDETLPETPTDDESVPEEEEPFVSEVSPEMMARLQRNADRAAERLQRMGMLA
jgi:hypothetical protein